MTYTELFRTFEKYAKYIDDTTFILLEVEISKIKYQGRDAYVFVHNKISYFALDDYDKPLTDDIQILLYKEVKKFIRIQKIKELLLNE